jgi:O-antigen/teichoic acid export membrane protein
VTSFWPIIKDSFPIALTMAFTIFYLQINKILLLKWEGAEATGIYGAADVIVMTFMILSNSLVLATFPIISREYRISKENTFPIYKGVFKFLITSGLPIALGGMLLNKEIISLIYGVEFSESNEVLKILIWLTPIIFLTNFMGSCLIAIEKQKQLAIICGFNTVLNLTLNFILIPRYGYVGAAIASLATEGANLIIQYQCLKYYWEASIFDPSLLKVIFSLGLMGLFIHWVQGSNLFLILFGAIVLYIVSLFATGFYSHRELSVIKTWLCEK